MERLKPCPNHAQSTIAVLHFGKEVGVSIDRCFDGEGAAVPLHRHAYMGCMAVDDVEQLIAHFGGDGVESGVPR